MAEYEKIGSWLVNTNILTEVRRVFREDTEAWLKGEVTDHQVFCSMLFSNIGLLGKRFPSHLPFPQKLEYAKGAMKAFYKELAEREKGNDLCYAEHPPLAMTIAVPPDPFVAEYSYYTGKPVDVYRRVLEKAPMRIEKLGVLTKKQHLVMQPCDPWTEHADAVEPYRQFSPLSNVLVFINHSSREARMESIIDEDEDCGEWGVPEPTAWGGHW